MAIKRVNAGPRMSSAVVHGNTVYLAGLTADDTKADVKEATKDASAATKDAAANAGGAVGSAGARSAAGESIGAGAGSSDASR